jgi:quinol monooxygenase YgiN
MHRRTKRGLVLAALVAVSGESALADEQVIIAARFYPAPGREAELETRLLKTVKFVRQAEPNITYRLHRSAQEPTVFLFYEVHASEAARDQHRQIVAAFQQELGPRPEGIFSRPPEVEVYRLLAE